MDGTSEESKVKAMYIIIENSINNILDVFRYNYMFLTRLKLIIFPAKDSFKPFSYAPGK